MNNYDDIIDLPHHTSLNHPKMTLEARSAQFAPFAALTGYSDAIKEESRLTKKKIELSEELKSNVNSCLYEINESIKNNPLVSITYFVKDKKKDGGEYKTITDNVKRIDDVLKCIKLKNNIIYLEDILLIEIIK